MSDLRATLQSIETHNRATPADPANLRWAATHEALSRSWIFDVLMGLADALEGASVGRTIPARTTDPGTSHAATATVTVKAGTQRALLLAAFALEAAADGLTDEEAADLADGVPYRSEYAKRCSELREGGLIETTGGTRAGVAGHQRIVSRITDRGRAMLAQVTS